MVEWDKVGDLERYPILELKEIGDFSVVSFLDEGRDVSAELIQKSLKDKGQKGIESRDSIVFHVQDADKKGFEVWLSAKAYTNLGELKSIREANGNSLVFAKVKISRVSKSDHNKPAFKFEKA